MIIALVAFAAADVCTTEEFVQDLNCNGVEVMDEVGVDLTDPDCLVNTNEAGIPFPNADFYYDYVSYGCQVPVIGLDLDKDGLAGGDLSLMPDETFPDVVVTLTCDNCPENWNRDQLDTDCDNVGDLCDNCVEVYNPNQDDVDGDGYGDFCDTCPYVADVPQEDFDIDGFGDACDNCPDVFNFQGDEDEDGIGDDCDNCWDIDNTDQSDVDADELGDVCDNCPDDRNFPQEDKDEDLVGDACDVCENLSDDQTDGDGDGVGDPCDICPSRPDTDQLDVDNDGYGDACDVCPATFDPPQYDKDFDGTGDSCDDCPSTYDPFQLDDDLDGVGDACQACLGAGWDPGECADYAARGGASTCGTPGVPVLWGVLASVWLVSRRAARAGVIVGLAAGCGFIPASEREWRLDPDGDGAEWPDDCDSNDPTVGSGAPWFYDEDGDGYGGLQEQPACESPGDFWTRSGEDCDDDNPLIFPGAPESCDGKDEDCDLEVDEGFPVFTIYSDSDGDGFGGVEAGEACTALEGTALNDGDCNDTSAASYPDAREVCNNLDDDCDGLIDEALLAIWWLDDDNDGYGDPATAMETCEPPKEYIARGEDCDDSDEKSYPYAREICDNGADNDCDGVVDQEHTRWMDLDGDGFGDPSTERSACEPLQGEVDNLVDCDDTDPYVNPAVVEVCGDGYDNDCDDIEETCE
jgi:hypothetical protein